LREDQRLAREGGFSEATEAEIEAEIARIRASGPSAEQECA
jgi:hypothetical protein